MSIRMLHYHLANIKKYRLTAGRGGWHIIDQDGESIGKVSRIKGTDQRIIVLKGTIAKIKDVIESGLLSGL